MRTSVCICREHREEFWYLLPLLHMTYAALLSLLRENSTCSCYDGFLKRNSCIVLLDHAYLTYSGDQHCYVEVVVMLLLLIVLQQVDSDVAATVARVELRLKTCAHKVQG